MDTEKGAQKLDIPTSYDDPQRDAVEIKHRLDKEVRRESDVFRRSISGEYRAAVSPTLSTATGTPDRRIQVPRMNSNVSESSDKARQSIRKSKMQDEPFATFTDFESSGWPSPPLGQDSENPFVLRDSSFDSIELVTSLSNLTEKELQSVLCELVAKRPSLRPVIHSAISP